MTLQCNAVANQGNESTVIALWLLHVILASCSLLLDPEIEPSCSHRRRGTWRRLYRRFIPAAWLLPQEIMSLDKCSVSLKKFSGQRRLFLTKALNAIKVDNEIWDQSTACFSVSRNTRACLGGQGMCSACSFLDSDSFGPTSFCCLPRLCISPSLVFVPFFEMLIPSSAFSKISKRFIWIAGIKCAEKDCVVANFVPQDITTGRPTMTL
ncbi:hypothetical protein EDD18DRAFT_368067 [Armillaria luteobubalina]|uniref:Secreted protein n=1 Tax=Armillaria luteobubalina TaxID=153913 RepID=A0AA39UMK3_9AGAR|nr:hypothetical protein EDD18DRAFT_368067 [Armillaria luteobubalina]